MLIKRYFILMLLLGLGYSAILTNTTVNGNIEVSDNITANDTTTSPKYCIGVDCITAWASNGSFWDITGSDYLYNNTGILDFNTTAGDLRYVKDTDESNLNVNSSNETTYWDGETSQSDLNVNDSNSSSFANSSAFWDNLNSPSDINTGDLTDDGTYFQNTGEDTIILGDNTTTTQTLMTILNSVGYGYELIYNNTLYDLQSYVYQYGANIDSVIYQFTGEGGLFIETTNMAEDVTLFLRHDNASHINTSVVWEFRANGEADDWELTIGYGEGANLSDVHTTIMKLRLDGVTIYTPLIMNSDILMSGYNITNVAQIDNAGDNITVNDSLVLPPGENIYFEVTKEIEINPARFKLPGANFPAFDVLGMFPVLKFDPTVNESAHASMHVVEDYKEGSNFSIAFYWSPEDSGIGNVTWCIELIGLTAEIDETLNDAGANYCVTDDAQLTVMELLKTNLIEIDGSSISIDD